MNDEATVWESSELEFVGRYRRIAVIGHGGMADVLLASASGLARSNKLLVLKQLRPGHRNDPELLAMFMDEARLATRLNHPNVVQTYEVGIAEGTPFIAMEFLDGQPLHRVLRRMSPTQWRLGCHLRVLCELLTALDYAHELTDYDGRPLEIVHRDVNPQNVFVTYEGITKLVDFGIAKALDSEAHTEVGTFKGKLAYMAPEQARSRGVDRRADVFAVGVMLYEALAGHRMWQGQGELEVLERLTVGDLPPLPAGVDPELEAVCRRALAIDPDERFSTAAEFRSRLEAAILEPAPSFRAMGNAIAKAFEPERRSLARLIEQRLTEVPTDSGMHRAAWPAGPEEETRPLSRPMLTTSAELDDVTRHAFERPNPSRIRRLFAVSLALALAGGTIELVRKANPDAWHDAPASTVTSSAPADDAPDESTGACDPSGPVVELEGPIATDTHLDCRHRYRLKSDVIVREGATLSMEPGTVILSGSEPIELVIEPGAQLSIPRLEDVAADSRGHTPPRSHANR